MVFQDPMGSLDPRQSVESLLLEGMKAHGLVEDEAAAGQRLRELLEAVGLPPAALKKYPHEFSGGQRQRIGIARALSVNPKLIVADEPVSALDVSVQAQVINLLEDLQEEFGLTYLVIAHDLAVVRHISDRVGVMYLGALVEEAPPTTSTREPLHPTPERCCRPCRCPTRSSRTSGSGSCSRATCPLRPTRRRAAGSTPAARGGSRPGATPSDRRCASSTSTASRGPPSGLPLVRRADRVGETPMRKACLIAQSDHGSETDHGAPPR